MKRFKQNKENFTDLNSLMMGVDLSTTSDNEENVSKTQTESSDEELLFHLELYDEIKTAPKQKVKKEIKKERKKNIFLPITNRSSSFLLSGGHPLGYTINPIPLIKRDLLAERANKQRRKEMRRKEMRRNRAQTEPVIHGNIETTKHFNFDSLLFDHRQSAPLPIPNASEYGSYSDSSDSDTFLPKF